MPECRHKLRLTLVRLRLPRLVGLVVDAKLAETIETPRVHAPVSRQRRGSLANQARDECEDEQRVISVPKADVGDPAACPLRARHFCSLVFGSFCFFSSLIFFWMSVSAVDSRFVFQSFDLRTADAVAGTFPTPTPPVSGDTSLGTHRSFVSFV